MNRIGIGVAGYGYWGPNLVRNFAEASAVRVLAVSDRRRDRLEVCARRYPGIRTTTEFRDLLDDPAIEAVVIATPVNTHFALAQAALRAGKHVFVEKPMTETSEEGERLIDEAERRGLTLMVDHTFVFTPAVQKINEPLSENAIGDVYYYDSVRVNLGNFQCDVNVIWDLAFHDFSILDSRLRFRPVSGRRIGEWRSAPAGQPGEHRLHHDVLRWRADCPHQRELAGAGEGPQDPDRRQREDDRV
jgi:predicted dehydrogenase